MKTMKTTLLLIAAFLTAGLLNLNAQTARLQVIHNSADNAATIVDVWVNNELFIDDFRFRTSTPFVDVPAEMPLTIAIQPANSISSDDPLYSVEVKFDADKSYIVVADGIVSPSGYDPAQPFGLYIYDGAREMALTAGTTDVLVHHGATDAPPVDVVETKVGAGTIVNDLPYAEFAGYLSLPAADYRLALKDRDGIATLASFEAPLASLGLENTALSVIASGFLSPGNNSDGPGFGLFVALPSGGELIPLPFTPDFPVKVQIIHNSPDLAAEFVDVWANGQLLIDNFQFRTSTPFIEIPALTDIEISIQPANSTTHQNAVYSTMVNFEENRDYIVIASGLLNSSGYSNFEPFGLSVYPMARTGSAAGNTTDVLVYHGATDVPVVDVVETRAGAGTIVNNLPYGGFAGYLELPTADYRLDLRDISGTYTLASYEAPLSTLGLGGQALSVLASGFFNPAANNNGPAFGLYVALADGGNLIPLPAASVPRARVQVIHNAADPDAALVDVWFNEYLLLDNFTFRTATPFIDAPANAPFTLSVQPANSSSFENPLWSAQYRLEDGKTYIMVASGMLSGTGFSPAEPFEIYIYDQGRESALSAENTDILIFHGATDAPVVDVVETGAGAGTVADNLGYGEFYGYIEVPTSSYIFEVRDETGSATVAAYDAPLADLGLFGESITVLASGFLNPEANNRGAGFGLYVALASGGDLVALSPAVTTSSNSIANQNEIKIWAGNDGRTLIVEGVERDARVRVVSLSGQTVVNGNAGNGTINLDRLVSGMYLVRVEDNNRISTAKVLIP